MTPEPLYKVKKNQSITEPPEKYLRILEGDRQIKDNCVVAPRSGKAFKVAKGQICRISLPEGPQVADLNLWNAENPKERFWASRTKQLHSAHMNPFDHFWSCLPYHRRMATVLAETIEYGLDEHGAGCHDLLGTRCDSTIHRMLTGEQLDYCCHDNLLRAASPFGLSESDIHDVLNVFQVTGLTRREDSYFVKPCPAEKGDFFEFYAEINLLCAVSACPHGDMSGPIWGPDAVDTSMICRPLEITIYDVRENTNHNNSKEI